MRLLDPFAVALTLQRNGLTEVVLLALHWQQSNMATSFFNGFANIYLLSDISRVIVNFNCNILIVINLACDCQAVLGSFRLMGTGHDSGFRCPTSRNVDRSECGVSKKSRFIMPNRGKNLVIYATIL